jgi:hypothetical protein
MPENRYKTATACIIAILVPGILTLAGCHTKEAAAPPATAPQTQSANMRGTTNPVHPPVIVHGGSFSILASPNMISGVIGGIKSVSSFSTTGFGATQCAMTSNGCTVSTNWIVQICDTNPANNNINTGCADGVKVCTSSSCTTTGSPTVFPAGGTTYSLWVRPINPNGAYGDNIGTGAADPGNPGYYKYPYNDGTPAQPTMYSLPGSVYIYYGGNQYGPFPCLSGPGCIVDLADNN